MSEHIGAVERSRKAELFAAYDQQFVRRFRQLAAFAAMLGHPDPHDAPQDALWLARDKVALLDHPERLDSYLRQIILNKTRSHYRAHRVLLRRIRDLADPSETPSAEQVVTARHRLERVRPWVEALPRRQREVVLLRYWLDMSEADIAAELGIAPGSVKSHASRALASLAKRSAEEGWGS